MTKLLYLHGVGSAENANSWLPSLNASLAQRSESRIEADDVLTPNYVDTLGGLSTPQAQRPEPRRPSRGLDAAAEQFANNRALLERRLRRLAGKSDSPLARAPQFLRDQAFDHGPGSMFERSRRYATERSVRWSIWQQIVDCVDEGRALIIIGHSLGSVIAVDVIPYLPSALSNSSRHPRMVHRTAGNPLLRISPDGHTRH